VVIMATYMNVSSVCTTEIRWKGKLNFVDRVLLLLIFHVYSLVTKYSYYMEFGLWPTSMPSVLSC